MDRPIRTTEVPLPDAPRERAALPGQEPHERRASEAKFSAITMLLPDACGITRISDGRYIEVNPAFCALFELPREAVIGRTSVELGIWATPEEREKLLEGLRADGLVDGLVMRARSGGRDVPGRMSARPIQVDGEACMVFVFHDTTQEQRIHADLLAANALMNQAGHMAQLGAWEGDAAGTLQHWSDACSEVHGLPVGNKPPADYINQCIAPEFRDALRSAARACLREGKPWTLDLKVVRADNGQHRWMRAHGEAVRDDAGAWRMRGVMQDIDAAHRAEQVLRQSQERFARFFELMPYPMGMSRYSDGTYLDINPAFEELLGLTREQAVGRNAVQLGILTPQVREDVINEARRTGQLNARELEIRTARGETRTVLQSMRITESDGEKRWMFAVQDITARKQAEFRLREREAVLSLTLEAASLGLWDCDIASGMLTGDARWHAMRGVQPTDQPVSFEHCAGTKDGRRLYAELKRHRAHPDSLFDLVTTLPGALEDKRWLRNLGKIVSWDADGKPERMLGVSIDVTGQRQQELMLQRLAHYDALTDLPNRVLMALQMTEAMTQARASGQLLGVAYLDLDGFKPVNDRFGHAGGDELLRCAAKRLTGALRPQDSVARLGGDEFAILLPELASSEDAQRALERVMRSISAVYTLEGESVCVTASIGYTLYPRDDADADTLLRHADQAMYAAKQAGRNRFQEFDAAHDRALRDTRSQVIQVREALAAGQFELYLQPKVDMRLGTVVGAEALARWNDPDRGLLAPAAFLHLVDDKEVEATFGTWVVQSGLDLVQHLMDAGLEIPVSVNIAAAHLQQADFAPWMAEQLAAHPAAYARLLDIEITETAALLQIERVAQTLGALRKLGVSISLDDFGTGYSSLTYLRRLPLNNLKIDQSFVGGMLDEAGDLAIVQGVIGLARSFGYRVIAEGVETQDQGQMLLQMGCAQGQGYFIARPMPVAQFLTWARDWQAPLAWQQ